MIRQILDTYGIQYQRVLKPQKGYRNTSYAIELDHGQRINLMLYKSEPQILERIRRIHVVTGQLTDLPVRKNIDPRIITLQAGKSVRYGALYNYLPGVTIPWEAYTKNHIKLVGMAMSTLHASLKKVDQTGAKVSDEYLQINDRMARYFSQAGVVNAMDAKLHLAIDPGVFDHVEHILHLSSRLPNQQLLHMDFVRGNLLFTPASKSDVFTIGGVALTGIIDFEKVAYGHPAFDVARTLAFLLVDCKYKSSDKVMKYFLKSGYNKRGESKFSNVMIRDDGQSYDLLHELTDLFLLYDFYKFLRHNPYESLKLNEHFIRTRDILLERKVLKSC